MTTGTVRLHRVLRAPPERIYRAFVDRAALAKWFAPYGYVCSVEQLQAETGGSYRMTFTAFATGDAHSFGGTYRELVPAQRLRYTARFDDPNLPEEMQTTVTLRGVSCGTDIDVVQEGIPALIPTEMCYLGWQESLVQLGRLVEPHTT